MIDKSTAPLADLTAARLEAAAAEREVLDRVRALRFVCQADEEDPGQAQNLTEVLFAADQALEDAEHALLVGGA